jgi:hypothetical protein
MSVVLNDWREVDAAARAIGAGFASGDLRGEVDLIVVGKPDYYQDVEVTSDVPL